MKAIIRELIGDFKAAAAIGDPDSLEAVMDRIRSAEEDALPASALLPLGAALQGLPPARLIAWLDDDDAGVRGIAAAAIGSSDLGREEIPEAVLVFAADDPVDEVRAAFAEALAAGPSPKMDLVERLLADESIRVRRTGLLLIAHAPSLAMRSIEWLADFDKEEDHGLREDLVAGLNRLAEAGHAAAVLDLAEKWAGREAPNVWVLTRAVSAGWAQDHSERCVQVLKRLQEQTGELRAITRAMERHS